MVSRRHHVNYVIFQLLKEMALSAFCHSSESSTFASFARHSAAYYRPGPKRRSYVPKEWNAKKSNL